MTPNPLDQPAPGIVRHALIHVLEQLDPDDLARIQATNHEPEWHVPNLRSDGVTLRDVGRMLNLIASVLG